MMTKALEFMIVCLLLFTGGVRTLYANGGPANASAVKTLGEIRLEQTPEVKLISEDLALTIRNDSIAVSVVYALKNITDSSQEITYAFPIDAWHGIFTDDSRPPQDLKIALDQSQLQYHLISEVLDKENEHDDEWTNRYWFVTGLRLKKQSVHNLSVTYTVRAGFFDMENGKSMIPEYSDRRLRWDFTPAGYWGRGVASRINITIDARDIIRKQGTVQIENLTFTEKNGVYAFTENDFEFEKHEALTITYDYEEYKQNIGMMRFRVKMKDDIRLNASSQAKGNYGIENITDGSLSTAWVEGVKGAGTGEYVEVALDSAYTFNSFAVLPGYLKSEATYSENNRIKELEVVAFYHNGDTVAKTITFTDEEYNDQFPMKVNFVPQTTTLYSFQNRGQHISKLRFIVKDVYKGTKYDDTCISEIIFFNLLVG